MAGRRDTQPPLRANPGPRSKIWFRGRPRHGTESGSMTDTEALILHLAQAPARQPRPASSPSSTRPGSSEPILIPVLRIQFADFPYLHYSIDQRLFTLGDLLRGYKYEPARRFPRGPLPDFRPRKIRHRCTGMLFAFRKTISPARGFHGTFERLCRKENSSPDLPTASPGPFGLLLTNFARGSDFLICSAAGFRE
ncbi:hypothetical protein JTB14_027751 [Gonioctena quinquepunctata]|nr:hypothetical protein JTB14_027751 [Gonioctena quinquepunctata]